MCHGALLGTKGVCCTRYVAMVCGTRYVMWGPRHVANVVPGTLFHGPVCVGCMFFMQHVCGVLTFLGGVVVRRRHERQNRPVQCLLLLLLLLRLLLLRLLLKSCLICKP